MAPEAGASSAVAMASRRRMKDVCDVMEQALKAMEGGRLPAGAAGKGARGAPARAPRGRQLKLSANRLLAQPNMSS